MRVKELKISNDNENCESFNKNLLDRSDQGQVKTQNKGKDEGNNNVIVDDSQINPNIEQK